MYSLQNMTFIENNFKSIKSGPLMSQYACNFPRLACIQLPHITSDISFTLSEPLDQTLSIRFH